MKTLAALDPAFTEESSFDSSLTQRVWAMRNLTPDELSPAQLALCLRQLIVVEHVVPLALQLVAREPLLEAELYPGDLLNSLLHAAQNLKLDSAQQAQLRAICVSASTATGSGESQLASEIRSYVGSHHDA